MKRHPRSILYALACVLALSSLSVPSRAADKVDPTGTWTWTFTLQNGDTINPTLRLKLADDKLTGTITGRDGNETEIQNGKLAGDQISFQVVRERDGNKFTTKYTGRVAPDTIKGKMAFERDGETRERDWEAKRKGAKTSRDLTGSWTYSFTTSGGQTFEPTLKLKQDGEKLMGVVVFNGSERAISEGKVTDGQFSFKVVRERDGETFTTKYNGKLEGDALKGKINSNYGGTDRTYDLDAKRAKE